MRSALVFVAVLLVAAACGDPGADTTTVPTITLPPETTVTTGGPPATAGTTTTAPTPTTTTTEGGCVTTDDRDTQFSDVGDHVFALEIGHFGTRFHSGDFKLTKCHHDWSTDDCSAPGIGSSSVSFDFEHPCHRHDFGYRNYKRIRDEFAVDAWTADLKLAVDQRFHFDMQNHCFGRSLVLRPACYTWAEIFYRVVFYLGT